MRRACGDGGAAVQQQQGCGMMVMVHLWSAVALAVPVPAGSLGWATDVLARAARSQCWWVPAVASCAIWGGGGGATFVSLNVRVRLLMLLVAVATAAAASSGGGRHLFGSAHVRVWPPKHQLAQHACSTSAATAPA